MSGNVEAVGSSMALGYRWTAGSRATGFFEMIKHGRIAGNACRTCHLVYVPPRAACPKCWDRCSEEFVDVSDEGVVQDYVVVRVTFPGQEMTVPYIFANVLLDGADLAIEHIINEVGPDGQLVAPSDLTVGMRVKATWCDTEDRTGFINDDILYFQPVRASAH